MSNWQELMNISRDLVEKHGAEGARIIGKVLMGEPLDLNFNKWGQVSKEEVAWRKPPYKTSFDSLLGNFETFEAKYEASSHRYSPIERGRGSTIAWIKNEVAPAIKQGEICIVGEKPDIILAHLLNIGIAAKYRKVDRPRSPMDGGRGYPTSSFYFRTIVADPILEAPPQVVLRAWVRETLIPALEMGPTKIFVKRSLHIPMDRLVWELVQCGFLARSGSFKETEEGFTYIIQKA